MALFFCCIYAKNNIVINTTKTCLYGCIANAQIFVKLFFKNYVFLNFTDNEIAVNESIKTNHFLNPVF